MLRCLLHPERGELDRRCAVEEHLLAREVEATKPLDLAGRLRLTSLPTPAALSGVAAGPVSVGVEAVGVVSPNRVCSPCEPCGGCLIKSPSTTTPRADPLEEIDSAVVAASVATTSRLEVSW